MQSFFCSAVLTRSTTNGTLLLDSPFPEGIASWVNYSSPRTESSTEHFASDLSLLKADTPWCESKRCSDSNPWPMDPKASVLFTTPQRPTNVCPFNFLVVLRNRRPSDYVNRGRSRLLCQQGALQVIYECKFRYEMNMILNLCFVVCLYLSCTVSHLMRSIHYRNWLHSDIVIRGRSRWF